MRSEENAYAGISDFFPCIDECMEMSLLTECEYILWEVKKEDRSEEKRGVLGLRKDSSD